MSAGLVVWRGLALTATVVASLAGEPRAEAAETKPEAWRPRLGIGVEAGVQNLIGGARVGNTDVLGQASRAVGSVFLGCRLPIGGRFFADAEAGFGLTDGHLRLEDPARSVRIAYDNDQQIHYGLVIGRHLGPAANLFAYVYEVSRTFDVTVTDAFGPYAQRDEQGLLRFGIGGEVRLRGPWVARLALGSSRADFGGQTTNIEPATKLDAALGIVWWR